MAGEGIKISQLAEVNATENDYTVVVQDGITRKALISSITNLASGGQTADINGLKRDLSELNRYTYSLSTNEQLANAIDDIYGTLASNVANLQNTDNNLEINIGIANDRLNVLAESLNLLSDLIDDPDMISSLTSTIALLAGEDGQASLSNITKSIIEISNDVEELKDVKTALEDTALTVNNILNDTFDNTHFSHENNSLLAVAVNDDYAFNGYDEKHFANVDGAMPGMLRATLSALCTDNDETVLTTFTITSDFPAIDALENSYNTESAIYPGLSNVSFLSTVSIELIDDELKRVSSYYETTINIDDSVTIGVLTASSEDLTFPGDSTFSLNMIPIRAGMFTVDGSGNLVLETKLSGNSDFALYYAKNAKLLANSDCDVKIYINGEFISKRHALSSAADMSDCDLDLIVEKMLKGGSTIKFEVEDPPQSQTASTYSLLASIYAKRLPSERPIESVEIVSAWNNYTDNIAHELTSVGLNFKLNGGITGDRYCLSVSYVTDNNPDEIKWLKWTNDNTPPQLTVDNAVFHIDPLDPGSTILSGQLTSDCNIFLNLIKLYDSGAEEPNVPIISSDAFRYTYGD